MITWPTWMPAPKRESYGMQPVDRRTKTEMEIGGVYRTEFNTDESTCDCSLILSPDESAWFESFERGVLEQGSTWFSLPLWVGGRVEEHVVRFRERPRLTGIHGCYTSYSMQLEVSGRHLLCADDAEALMVYPPCEIRCYGNEFKVISKMYRNLLASLAGITNIPKDLPPFFN